MFTVVAVAGVVLFRCCCFVLSVGCCVVALVVHCCLLARRCRFVLSVGCCVVAQLSTDAFLLCAKIELGIQIKYTPVCQLTEKEAVAKGETALDLHNDIYDGKTQYTNNALSVIDNKYGHGSLYKRMNDIINPHDISDNDKRLVKAGNDFDVFIYQKRLKTGKTCLWVQSQNGIATDNAKTQTDGPTHPSGRRLKKYVITYEREGGTSSEV